MGAWSWDQRRFQQPRDLGAGCMGPGAVGDVVSVVALVAGRRGVVCVLEEALAWG